MDAPNGRPDQEQVEAAVRATLLGWGAELDRLQKFVDGLAADDRRRRRGDTQRRASVLRGRRAFDTRALADVEDSPVRELLLTLDEVFRPRKAGQWLLAPNRARGGKRPIEVVAVGDIDAVRRAADASAGLPEPQGPT